MSEHIDTFNIAWGKQTFDRRQTQVHLFCYTEQATTVFVNRVLHPTHKMSKTLASTDGFPDHGAWYRETIESQTGIMILLKAQDQFNGAVRAQAGAFLELNPNAPLIKIAVPLCSNRLARYDEMDCFIGRAYLLSPEEVEARGYKVRPSFVNAFFDQEEIDELLDVEELMSQRAEKPTVETVTTSKGEQKKMLIADEPKRKLRVRKKA